MADTEDGAVSRDKQYEDISKRVGDLYAATYNGMKFFLQVFTAIIGGSFWLNSKLVEWGSPKIVHEKYALLSVCLVILVTAASILMTLENTGTWRIWRKWLSEITVTSPIPMPMRTTLQSWYVETAICIGMLVADGMFYWFNPFTISN